MSVSLDGDKTDVAEPSPIHGRVGGEAVRIERGAVGMVQAERVELQSAAAGVVVASKDVTIQSGGARDIIAGGGVRVSQGGAGALISLGPTEIQRGGIVVFALTPKLEVAPGGRVLVGPIAAFALIGLAAVCAILMRRR